MSDRLFEAVTEVLSGGGALMATLVERWLEQGRKEGFQEGKRQAVLQLLAARFGPASPKVKGQIETISDIALLDQLFSDALTFTSDEQLE